MRFVPKTFESGGSSMNTAANPANNKLATTDEELTAIDAARQLGIELNRVYVLLRLGRLAGRKIADGTWRVDMRAVEDRLQRRKRITA
jgi:hypothetical protein